MKQRSLALFAFFILVGAWLLYAQTSSLATITFVKGSVKILRSGQQDWTDALKDMTMGQGDRLRTDEDGKAVFVYADMSVIKMKSNTVCEPLPVQSGLAGVKMDFGTVFVDVKPELALAKGVQFQLEGSKAIAGVRGTALKYSEEARLALMQSILSRYADLRNVPTQNPTCEVIAGIVQLQSKLKAELSALLKQAEGATIDALRNTATIRQIDLDALKKDFNETPDPSQKQIQGGGNQQGQGGTTTSTTTTTGLSDASLGGGTGQVTLTTLPRTEWTSLKEPVPVGGIITLPYPNSTVKNVSVNGNKASFDNTSFSATLTSINPGKNQVTVEVEFSDGSKVQTTDSFSTDSNSPILQVTSPVDNSHTGEAKIKLSGTVVDEAIDTVEFKVNDGSFRKATVTGSSFEYPIDLDSSRENTVMVRAVDKMGNATDVTIKVTVDSTLEQIQGTGKTGTVEIKF